MAENSAIAWTDDTFNPWIGCTRVSPGCDACYAEALDARYRFGGGTHWGPGVPRYKTKGGVWQNPRRWNVEALSPTWRGVNGSRRLVFCASLADVFDNEVPREWRAALWDLVEETKHLTWLLLTKRIGNVGSMIPDRWSVEIPENVWIGASIVNQEEADRDLPKLLRLKLAGKRFVSYEPALGPVDFRPFLQPLDFDRIQGRGDGFPYVGQEAGGFRGIDWIIVGGESRQGTAKARPFDLAWARSTVAQCRAAGVAPFVKQLGSNPVRETIHNDYGRFIFKDRSGSDPAEWPEDLRVQEFPK